MFLVLLIAAGISLVQPASTQKIPVLDLTTKVESVDSVGAPGVAIGGTVGGEHPVSYPPRYELPLSARIQSVRPSTIHPPEQFVIELLVRNIGKTPFYLPQFRDLSTVHAKGNKARRTFLFLVTFELPNRPDRQRSVVALTASAETIPGSMIELTPQQSVRVLLPADLGPIRDRLSTQTRKLTFRVVLHEWTLEDDRYFIKTLSEDLESENTATIAIRKDKPTPQQ